MNGQINAAIETVKSRKASMRKEMLAKRARLLEDYCRMADRGILERILALEAYREAKVLFTYVSVKGEADTGDLILRALGDGKKVAVPRCVEKGIMKTCRIRGMEDLETGRYGIPEPKGECREVKAEEIDLAVVPCVCCDWSGFRLGYGGGYYDRYLSGCGALRAALCRERMMVKKVPAEEHDRSMDLVITEESVLRFPRH